MPNAKLLGVTVLPEYFQVESVDGVLDNLVAAGVNAVTTSPYCMEPADERTGGREPPIDAGAGKVRLLDRPLWGQRELFVRTAPSFVPEKSLYAGLRYQPAEPDELTARDGQIVADAIRAAHARHLQVFLQVQAAIPPGYRVQFGGPHDDDKPRLPDGSIPAPRVANNGSLASADVVGYTQALLTDLLRVYPEIDGIRLDWPEYPPYSLNDVFVDFSPLAAREAKRRGYDFERMRRQVAELYAFLHGGLTDQLLAAQAEPDAGRYHLLRGLGQQPGIADWLALKSDLVVSLLETTRATIRSASGGSVKFVPHAFPPPFTLASGIDFARAAPHSDAFCVKLYTMHWDMMLRGYGEALRTANPQVSEALLVRALVSWFDLLDLPVAESRQALLSDLDAWRYPEPEEPHAAGPRAQVRKIEQAQTAAGDVPVFTLVHGYGPVDDFRARLKLAWDASPHGVWINRYCYLRDDKLAAIREVCGG